MNAKWTWIVGVAAVIGSIIAIVLGLLTVGSQFGVWVFGALVGLGLGLILCVLIFFGRTSGGKTRQEQLDNLLLERGMVQEQLTVAQHDAIPRSDSSVTVPGRPPRAGKSSIREKKEVEANAKGERLEGELANIDEKIGPLRKKLAKKRRSA